MGRMEAIDRLLILGDGYLTSFLERRCQEEQIPHDISSRSKSGRLRFEMEKRSTWTNISEKYSHSILTFALPSSEIADEFSQQKSPLMGKTLIVSSTGFFDTKDGDTVNESSPLNLNLERAKAEEFLRQKGAIILHSAGIYGPGRDPRDWVRAGRVGLSPKWVNLVHVEDLVEFCLLSLRKSGPSERYLASDGTPLTWQEIIEKWHKEFSLPALPKKIDRPSKKVDPSESIRRLGVQLQYKNVFEGVHGC